MGNLPFVVSSAGVPMTEILPHFNFENTSFKPNAAPKLLVAIMLCPQPCPMSGKASYSQTKAIAGLSFECPIVATKDVSIPASPFFILNPFFFKTSHNNPLALYSCNPSSGL